MTPGKVLSTAVAAIEEPMAFQTFTDRLFL